MKVVEFNSVDKYLVGNAFRRISLFGSSKRVSFGELIFWLRNWPVNRLTHEVESECSRLFALKVGFPRVCDDARRDARRSVPIGLLSGSGSNSVLDVARDFEVFGEPRVLVQYPQKFCLAFWWQLIESHNRNDMVTAC